MLSVNTERGLSIPVAVVGAARGGVTKLNVVVSDVASMETATGVTGT